MIAGDRNRTLALGLIDDMRSDLDAGDIGYTMAMLGQLEQQVKASICPHCPHFMETLQNGRGTGQTDTP